MDQEPKRFSDDDSVQKNTSGSKNNKSDLASSALGAVFTKISEGLTQQEFEAAKQPLPSQGVAIKRNDVFSLAGKFQDQERS